MRTVYLGTSEFAVDVLERLAATPHRPVLVVTRPDRPRGRGRKLQPPPVAERAALVPATEDVPPGRLDVRDSRVLYGAAQGALELLEVQPPGKRPMDAAAWLRGRPG